MADSSGSSGIAFIVGGLVVVVAVIVFFMMGGNFGSGTKEVDVKIEAPSGDSGGSSSGSGSGN